MSPVLCHIKNESLESFVSIGIAIRPLDSRQMHFIFVHFRQRYTHLSESVNEYCCQLHLASEYAQRRNNFNYTIVFVTRVFFADAEMQISVFSSNLCHCENLRFVYDIVKRRSYTVLCKFCARFAYIARHQSNNSRMR